MSVKDVKKYYNDISEQYKEMVENIRDLEEEASKGLVEPERIERLQEQIAPIKQNYERWSYMMFLLNEPRRKSKKALYQSKNKKQLATLSPENSIEATIQENNESRKIIGK